MPYLAKARRASSRAGRRVCCWPLLAPLACLLAAAPLAVIAGPGAAEAQSSKQATKAKTAPKKAAPPLPGPSPNRVADAPSPADAIADGGPTPPAKPAAAVPSAVPGSPEAGYLAAMDKLIAPLLEAKLPAADAQRLKDALSAVDGNDPAEAHARAAKIGDPTVQALVMWYALRNGAAAAADYAQFLAEHSAWPDAPLLRRRSEQQLLASGGPAKEILAFFSSRPPISGAGTIALASAHLALGDETRAKELAAKAWRENDIPAPSETGFLARFDRFLTAADHRRRLDVLLIDEGRFAAQRTPRVAAARRLLPKLQGVERKKAEARIAVYARAGNAAKLMASLPAAAKEPPLDTGLLFQRIQLARSQGKEDEVARLLRLAPADAEALVDPDAWWLHRRWAIYEFLGNGRFKEAYDLARAPGPLTANPIKDATFLAGWIALRHLKDSKAALPHLEASRKHADGPLSAARGNYWLARAHEALGQTAEATRYYEEAAARIDTFHGALARQKLNPGPQSVAMSLPALPSADVAERFNANPLVRAAVLAHHADVGRGITRIIVAHLRSRLESEAEVAMLAHLASALGDHQMAVRVGKTGVARGMNLFVYSYPVHPFPEYKPLRRSPERALLLAIARQESEFNPEIVSHAGARGLLQVMPITARHICRDHKIKCDIPRLITDTSYNAMIASAYIGDRKEEFSGSYVLTLAGYNAGPGRARQWMRRFGDPRNPGIDPIDWIEMIPFEETRDYVKKVLSNVQMYRARLGEPTPVRLVSDLKR
ncbi:MAG: transglycosylase SLT domain-containing protein [Hyphomicrobiaceae bacterium]